MFFPYLLLAFLNIYFQTGTTDSTMLVVSDIEDVFLPKPNDLLVNIAESRASLEALLGRIGDMFQDNSIVGSAMGPALQAGFKLMVGIFSFPFIFLTDCVVQAPIGGKIIVLSSTLPSIGPGSLKNREDPKILGTSKVSFVLHLLFYFHNKQRFRNLAYSKRRHRSTRLLRSSAQERRSQWTCSFSVLLIKTLLPLVITYLKYTASVNRNSLFSMFASLHLWSDLLLPCIQCWSIGRRCEICT